MRLHRGVRFLSSTSPLPSGLNCIIRAALPDPAFVWGRGACWHFARLVIPNTVCVARKGPPPVRVSPQDDRTPSRAFSFCPPTANAVLESASRVKGNPHAARCEFPTGFLCRPSFDTAFTVGIAIISAPVLLRPSPKWSVRRKQCVPVLGFSSEGLWTRCLLEWFWCQRWASPTCGYISI